MVHGIGRDKLLLRQGVETTGRILTVESFGNPVVLKDPLQPIVHPNVESSRLGTDFKWGADVPVSASQTQVAKLEATIRSAHALLQAGLIDEATTLLAAFSTEVQPRIDRVLTEVRSNVDRTLPNAERW